MREIIVDGTTVIVDQDALQENTVVEVVKLKGGCSYMLQVVSDIGPKTQGLVGPGNGVISSWHKPKGATEYAERHGWRIARTA